MKRPTTPGQINYLISIGVPEKMLKSPTIHVKPSARPIPQPSPRIDIPSSCAIVKLSPAPEASPPCVSNSTTKPASAGGSQSWIALVSKKAGSVLFELVVEGLLKKVAPKFFLSLLVLCLIATSCVAKGDLREENASKNEAATIRDILMLLENTEDFRKENKKMSEGIQSLEKKLQESLKHTEVKLNQYGQEMGSIKTNLETISQSLQALPATISNKNSKLSQDIKKQKEEISKNYEVLKASVEALKINAFACMARRDGQMAEQKKLTLESFKNLEEKIDLIAKEQKKQQDQQASAKQLQSLFLLLEKNQTSLSRNYDFLYDSQAKDFDGVRKELVKSRESAVHLSDEQSGSTQILWGMMILLLIFQGVMFFIPARKPRIHFLPVSAVESRETPAGEISSQPENLSLPGKKDINLHKAIPAAIPAVEKNSQKTAGEIPVEHLDFPEISRSSDPWNLGFATTTGKVREDNQDCCIAFEIEEHQIVVMADGMGGAPLGKDASHLAVQAAVSSVLASFALKNKDPSRVSRIAFHAAFQRLMENGRKMNIQTVEDGLRTTLIVIIASKHEIGFTYIGDGGAMVLRASGKIENFLKPHKASAEIQNVLSASLGPIIQGEPVSGKLGRKEGDFLIISTDGVCDYVQDSFPREVIRQAILNEGDLQKTAQIILEEMEEARDEGEFACSDNMTLALVGGKTKPRFPKDFFKQ